MSTKRLSNCDKDASVGRSRVPAKLSSSPGAADRSVGAANVNPARGGKAFDPKEFHSVVNFDCKYRITNWRP
jgi:hypothetical protein